MRDASTPFGFMVALLALVVGLIVAFAGFRLARAFAALAGVLVGFAFGLAVGTALTLNPLVGVVVGMGAAVVGALLFVLAFRLVGAVLGALVLGSLAFVFGLPPVVAFLAGAVGAVVGFVANRAVVIVATAVTGAWLAAESGLAILGVMGVGFSKDELAMLVGALLVALAGAAVQWRATRRPG